MQTARIPCLGLRFQARLLSAQCCSSRPSDAPAKTVDSQAPEAQRRTGCVLTAPSPGHTSAFQKPGPTILTRWIRGQTLGLTCCRCIVASASPRWVLSRSSKEARVPPRRHHARSVLPSKTCVCRGDPYSARVPSPSAGEPTVDSVSIALAHRLSTQRYSCDSPPRPKYNNTTDG